MNEGGPGACEGRSLLAVFAHPDDESLACGGLLAWCAQLGARVSLVCATHGELGPTSDPSVVDRGGLREVRAQELHAAARVLGIADVVLLDYPDGFLPWVDANRLEADISGAIRRFRPDVVLTFGEDGLYWHPDHIAIHERTTAAVAALGDSAPALYYVTMPRGVMRAIVNTFLATYRERGEPPPTQVLGIVSIDAFGVGAEPPTLVIDVAAFADRKLAALRCHRTQTANDVLALMSDGDAERLLATEHFHRAPIHSGADAFIEQLAVKL